MKRLLLAVALVVGSVSIASAQYPQPYYQPYCQPPTAYNFSYLYLAPQPQYGLPGIQTSRFNAYPVYQPRGYYQPTYYYGNSFSWGW